MKSSDIRLFYFKWTRDVRVQRIDINPTLSRQAVAFSKMFQLSLQKRVSRLCQLKNNRDLYMTDGTWSKYEKYETIVLSFT